MTEVKVVEFDAPKKWAFGNAIIEVSRMETRTTIMDVISRKREQSCTNKISDVEKITNVITNAALMSNGSFALNHKFARVAVKIIDYVPKTVKGKLSTSQIINVWEVTFKDFTTIVGNIMHKKGLNPDLFIVES